MKKILVKTNHLKFDTDIASVLPDPKRKSIAWTFVSKFLVWIFSDVDEMSK